MNFLANVDAIIFDLREGRKRRRRSQNDRGLSPTYLFFQNLPT